MAGADFAVSRPGYLYHAAAYGGSSGIWLQGNSIWALITTVGCAGTFVGYPLWGTVYDLTGTYTLGLIGAAVLLAGAMWAHILTLKNVQ